MLDWLDANGLKQNTVVIYTSDQGFFLGEHGLFDKRFMYEESLRMPFLVRWPAGIKAGSTSTAIGINTDFAPTFLDLAGQATPGDMQGRSFLPVWKGSKPRDWRSAMYYRYYHDPGDHNTRAHYGVRTATHKLIYFWKKDQWECYDLVKDPMEMHNIYTDPKAQKIVAELKTELYRLKKELKDDDQFADKQPTESSYVAAPPPEKEVSTVSQQARFPFQVLSKPIGPICNLDCTYCFYLEKENTCTPEPPARPDGRPATPFSNLTSGNTSRRNPYRP